MAPVQAPGTQTGLSVHLHTQVWHFHTCTEAPVLRCSHCPADQPLLAMPCDGYQCTRATHRLHVPTAAVEPRACRPGRPRSGSPCYGWPSCGPALGSNRDSPGGRGGRPLGPPTLTAPSRAPRERLWEGRLGPSYWGAAPNPPPVLFPPPAHPWLGALHTPLPTGPSAGSRRKETKAWTFCES